MQAESVVPGRDEKVFVVLVRTAHLHRPVAMDEFEVDLNAGQFLNLVKHLPNPRVKITLKL